MITRRELIKEYIEFFKKRGHKEISNSSLIPKEDPTVLFTTAGMHPLVPFLLGEKHPLGKRLCNVQKCIRTGDIEEVGDETHHTFFEMLGNWSLGDYWKKEAIDLSFEFLRDILKISKERISITCFEGDKDAKKDEESANAWKKLGIKDIKFLGKKDNWWGPAGEVGPCGPDTEMFVDKIEIWNDVFMEYYKNKEKKYLPAKQKNIDTGMGLERTIAVTNGLTDNYLTEVWKPIIKEIEKSFGKKYGQNKEDTKAIRIIADHIKASMFILSEGIIPSNKEHGYVLRRLIRRAIRYANYLGANEINKNILESVFKIYKEDYPELKENKNKILEEFKKEEDRFLNNLEGGLNKFKKIIEGKKELSGKDAFLLYQSFGFPIEMIEEETKKLKIKFDKKHFLKEQEKHQKLSHTASEGRFKSGLADNSEKTTKLHTATHLLLAGLKEILKEKNIIQKGSNITQERLRLDFSFQRKLSDEEIKKVEDLVNKKINEKIDIKKEEMPLEEAKKIGATGSFGEKYGKIVSVYTIGNISKEICSGPHVKNTKELGKFKILKEESSSSGIRRIKAVLF
jgi:alanyl-tRNA synthetase